MSQPSNHPATQPSDQSYIAALDLVAQLEAHLAYGRPIHTKSGRRLHDLESAVRAILADDLPPLSLSGRAGRPEVAGAGGEGRAGEGVS